MAEYTKQELELIVAKSIHKDDLNRRDICPIYRNMEELDKLLTYLAEPYQGKVDLVAAPEPLGFIAGGMIAQKLGVGFIPIRLGGAAPLPKSDVIRASYIDHFDHVRSLQIRKSNFPAGSRVLIVDDWIETAATMQTCISVIEEAEGSIEGIVSFGVNDNPFTQKMIESGQLRTIYCM